MVDAYTESLISIVYYYNYFLHFLQTVRDDLYEQCHMVCLPCVLDVRNPIHELTYYVINFFNFGKPRIFGYFGKSLQFIINNMK